MGNNLNKEGLDSVLELYESNSDKEEKQDTQKINNEWKRLASFMSKV